MIEIALEIVVGGGVGRGVVVAMRRGRHAAGAQQRSESGRRTFVVEADVRSTKSVDGMIARARELFGRLDIVIANAGIARSVPFEDLDDERWEETLDTNLGGVRRCFRAAMPAACGRLEMKFALIA